MPCVSGTGLEVRDRKGQRPLCTRRGHLREPLCERAQIDNYVNPFLSTLLYMHTNPNTLLQFVTKLAFIPRPMPGGAHRCLLCTGEEQSCSSNTESSSHVKTWSLEVQISCCRFRYRQLAVLKRPHRQVAVSLAFERLPEVLR